MTNTSGTNATVNQKYKDRLFAALFGSSDRPENALSLYNALNGSDYTDPSLITFNTIESVLYLGMHNDVSYIFAESEMILQEHQSTYNPNMPLRNLIYAGQLYAGYCEQKNYDLYSPTLKKIPAPRMIVFYNGLKDEPDQKVLRLSDAFYDGKSGDIEIAVHMLNINTGHNQELMDRCQPLKDYALFISSVRNYTLDMDMPLEEAIVRATKDLSDGDVKSYITVHQAEVTDMILEEYNEDFYRESAFQDGKEEGHEEGRKEGIAEGTASTYYGLVRDGILTPELASQRMNVSAETFLKKMADSGYKVPELV